MKKALLAAAQAARDWPVDMNSCVICWEAYNGQPGPAVAMCQSLTGNAGGYSAMKEYLEKIYIANEIPDLDDDMDGDRYTNAIDKGHKNFVAEIFEKAALDPPPLEEGYPWRRLGGEPPPELDEDWGFPGHS